MPIVDTEAQTLWAENWAENLVVGSRGGTCPSVSQLATPMDLGTATHDALYTWLLQRVIDAVNICVNGDLVLFFHTQ